MIILEEQSERLYPSLSYEPGPQLITTILQGVPLADISNFRVRFDVALNDVALNVLVRIADGGQILAEFNEIITGTGRFELGLNHKPISSTATVTISITAGRIRMAWSILVIMIDDSMDEW